MTNLANTKLAKMSREDRKSLKNSRGQILVSEIPDLAQVMEMRHNELLKYLHRCPASDFFGNAQIRTNKSFFPRKQVRKLVIDMIRKHSSFDLDVIQEFPSVDEKGSRYFISIKSCQKKKNEAAAADSVEDKDFMQPKSESDDDDDEDE